MNILIVPKIYCRFKNQTEYAFEKKILNFFIKAFPKASVEIATSINTRKKIDLIILSGGNNITLFSKKKEDIERNKIDKFFLKLSISKKIPIFGICHGAQFIAKEFGCKFKKSKNHIKNHYITVIKDKFNKKKYLVNSYHNITIIKKSEKVRIFAIAGDNSIEAFDHKKLKIGGVIWHPERFKKFRNIDIKLIRKFYATGNFGLGKR